VPKACEHSNEINSFIRPNYTPFRSPGARCTGLIASIGFKLSVIGGLISPTRSLKDTTILATQVTSTEMQLYEEGNPTLMDLLPQSVKEAYSRVPDDVKDMEDAELIRAMNDYSEYRKGPGSRGEDRRNDIRLKHSLWYEYDTAITEKRKMVVSNIIKGIMNPNNFTKTYLENKLRTEWMLRPPLNYWNEQRVLLEKSTMGLHEILDMPVVQQICRCFRYCVCSGSRRNPKEEKAPCKCEGKCICPPTVNTQLAQVKKSLHEMIEMRVKGAIVQKVRIDKQHLIAQIRTTEKLNQETALIQPKTSKDIDKEVLRLRDEVKKLKLGKRTDDTIDITPTDNDLQDAESKTKGD